LTDRRSSPQHDWVTAYEELRRAALEEPAAHARRAPGLALLLRAGTAAWMQTCQRVAGPVLSAPPSSATTRALPGIVRAEVTVLLAEMALAAATEGA
jgi:hypothetical protein